MTTHDNPRYVNPGDLARSVSWESDPLGYNIGDNRATVTIREGSDPYPHCLRIGLIDDAGEEMEFEFDEDEARGFARAILKAADASDAANREMFGEPDA